jgi:hypothetical protein
MLGEAVMADCERLGGCAFFSTLMADQSSLAGLFRQRYCRGHADQCARVLVEAAGLTVPDDLFPNQSQKAHDLISQAMDKTA